MGLKIRKLTRSKKERRNKQQWIHTWRYPNTYGHGLDGRSNKASFTVAQHNQNVTYLMFLHIIKVCDVAGLSSVSGDDGENLKLKNLFSLDVRFRPQAHFQLVDVIDKKGEELI